MISGVRIISQRCSHSGLRIFANSVAEVFKNGRVRMDDGVKLHAAEGEVNFIQ